MPDGAIREVPLRHHGGGNRAADFAAAGEGSAGRARRPIGPARACERPPDVADAAPEARLTRGKRRRFSGRFARADRSGRAAFDPDAERSRSDSGVAPLGGAFARRGGAGTFPGREAGHRPADRHRLFLRFCARGAVHARRPRAHREKDARAGRAGHSQRTQDDAEARSARALPQVGPGLQVRTGRGESHRADGVVLHHRKIHRFLPRAAHPLHRAHSRVQADERRRRLLERPGRQSADAAHLRRVLLHAAGARRISAPARRGQAARSSPARAGAGPVFAFRKRPGRG